jgi:hypothetical protein
VLRFVTRCSLSCTGLFPGKQATCHVLFSCTNLVRPRASLGGISLVMGNSAARLASSCLFKAQPNELSPADQCPEPDRTSSSKHFSEQDPSIKSTAKHPTAPNNHGASTSSSMAAASGAYIMIYPVRASRRSRERCYMSDEARCCRLGWPLSSLTARNDSNIGYHVTRLSRSSHQASA